MPSLVSNTAICKVPDPNQCAFSFLWREYGVWRGVARSPFCPLFLLKSLSLTDLCVSVCFEVLPPSERGPLCQGQHKTCLVAQGPSLRRALGLVSCSTAISRIFLLTFWNWALYFHFGLDPTKLCNWFWTEDILLGGTVLSCMQAWALSPLLSKKMFLGGDGEASCLPGRRRNGGDSGNSFFWCERIKIGMKEAYSVLRFSWSVKALWEVWMNISTSLHYIFGV
jgi:hypothetical protein